MPSRQEREREKERESESKWDDWDGEIEADWLLVDLALCHPLLFEMAEWASGSPHAIFEQCLGV